MNGGQIENKQFVRDAANMLLIGTDGQNILSHDFQFGGQDFAYVREHLHEYSLEDLHNILIMYDLGMHYHNFGSPQNPDLRHRKKIIWLSRYVKECIEQDQHGHIGQIYPVCHENDKNLSDTYIPMLKPHDNNENFAYYKPMKSIGDTFPLKEEGQYTAGKFIEQLEEASKLLGDTDGKLGDLGSNIVDALKHKNPKKMADSLSHWLDEAKNKIPDNNEDNNDDQDDDADGSSEKSNGKKANSWTDYLDDVSVNI